MNEQQAKRLSDCEILISKYQDQVNKLKSDILRDNEKLIYDEIEKRWKIYIEKINEEVQDIKKKLIDFDSKFQHQLELIDGMRKNHILLKSDLVQLKDSYDSSMQKHNDLEQRIKDIEIKNIIFNQRHSQHDEVKKDFIKHCAEVKEKNEEYKKFVDKHQENIKKINDNFVDLKNFVSVCNNNFDNVHELMEKDRQYFKEYNEKLSYSVGNISNNLYSQLSILSSSLHDRISGLNIPKPAPLDEIKKWIEDSKVDSIEKSKKILKDLDDVIDQSRLNQIQMVVLDKKLEKILSILENNNMRI